MSPAAADLPFTVIIPVFNAAATIQRALHSVGDLSGVVEVIVIDDGSTDDSAAIASRCKATVIRQANAGPAAARNLALDRCSTSSHALFLDADDVFRGTAFSAIVAALRRFPDAAGLIGAHTQVDGERRTLRRPEPEWTAASALPHPGAALGPSHVFCTSGFILTRRAISAGLRFDPDLHFAEDRDLVYRAARIGPIAVADACLFDKHAEAGRMTGDPRRISRWLRDQVALTRKHIADADPTTRDNLADSLQWVFKHAARTLARAGTTIEPPLASDASDLLRQLGRTAPRAVVRARLFARVRSLFHT